MLIAFPTDDGGEVLADPTKIIAVYPVPYGAAVVINDSITLLTNSSVHEVQAQILGAMRGLQREGELL